MFRPFSRTALLVLPFTLICLIGCGGGAGSSTGDAPVRVILSLDKETYQPGEPLVAEVLIVNTAARQLVVNVPSHKSLSFWQGAEDTSPVKSVPVFTDKDSGLSVTELPADDVLRRSFVFPKATLTSGTFTMQVSYDSDPQNALEEEFLANSRQLAYKVAGETIFHRDSNGILLKEDAIRIAKESADGEPDVGRVQLIVNEAGFYDWLVVLRPRGGEPATAYFVNPYLAKVRQRIDATDLLEPKDDKREAPRVPLPR